ncbi:MAG: DUF2585 family protein [Phycisphaerae bacterium]|nr:DUF2585 family protein [Phycisphaerae bacterium]
MTPPSHDPQVRLGRRSKRERWLLWVMLAVIAIMIVSLRLEERRWWCECGTVRPWISDIWTSHCSQHLLDPYSLTHFSHGLIFSMLLMLVVPRWTLMRRLLVAVTLAAGWEALENSPFIIERYRTATMSLNYLGDSVVNSTGDVLACAAGFLVAEWLGWRRSLVLFLAIEVALLLWIRDNLIVGGVMLIAPIDAIKQWQTASAPI